jgi:hypothetical protein
MSAEVRPEDLVEFRGSWQGTTNITYLRALYSIKRRKFIKGFYEGSRPHGDIVYKVLPGTYVVFDYHGWWKLDPPRKITVEMVKLERGEEGSARSQRLASVVIKFYSKDGEFLKQFPPQIIDFFNARPGYHSYPSLNFEKVYSEEEERALEELLRRGGEYVEGAEHE